MTFTPPTLHITLTPSTHSLLPSLSASKAVEELRPLFTRAGFYLTDTRLHPHPTKPNQPTLCCVACRCGPLSANHLIKLFKVLHKKYKLQNISLPSAQLAQAQQQLNTPHAAHKGSGVRAHIHIQPPTPTNPGLVTKTYINTPNILHSSLQAELNSRAALAHLPGVVPATITAPNQFTMPYVPNIYTYPEGSFKLYNLNKFKQIFNFIQHVYQEGWCMVDWNKDAFRFSHTQVFMIDYEYAYPHPAPQQFPTSPDITGIGQTHTTAAGDAVSFNTYWRPLLGLSLQQYTTLNAAQQRKARLWWWFTRHLPSTLRFHLKKMLKPIRQVMVYKITQTPSGQTVIAKRIGV